MHPSTRTMCSSTWSFSATAPIPLYSTLIVLSGYTFGAWTGAIISYFAALTGALFVFVVSRALLRNSIHKWLDGLTRIRRVVRAIEKRPKLLFLIRLAPYPYNVMNCLLAASPTLTLHTYTFCTALSLFKVVIHTYIGAQMHSFKDYHSAEASSDEESSTDVMANFWAIFGIVLCLMILVYLSIVARRAVDDELDDAPITPRDLEETRAFLSGNDSDVESALPEREMSQITYPSQQFPRPSFWPRLKLSTKFMAQSLFLLSSRLSNMDLDHPITFASATSTTCII